MAQVETLEIEHNFQEDVINQAAGRAPIDAKKLDQALASVAENQNLINENLKMLQRDDGQLQDAIVGPAQLQRSLLNLLKEFNLRGAYVAATYYEKNDAVDYDGSLWVCDKPHNSTSVFVESNWLRYGASGAEDVTVAAQQAQQAATAAAASLKNANTAASTAETLKTQTEAAAVNASNAASSVATQAQQVASNAGIAVSAKNRAETAAIKAESAANSSGLTTPTPIASADLAVLTGHYYTTALGGTQSEIVVTRSDSTIFQTKTTASGEILTRSFDVGATTFPPFVGQSVASIEALPTNAYTGMSMAVSDPARGGNFVFDAAKVGLNDGGYIINGWVRQTDHLEFRYWGVITVAAVLNKVFQTAINYNLPIRDYSETEITIPNANPEMAVASDFVAVRVLPSKTLTIETNCTINAMNVSFYGDQTKGKNLTAAATAGQYTVTISDASGVVPGSIITIRNNVDFSFADFSASDTTKPNYRSYYKDGEMAQVLSVSGNTVTLTQPLISSYVAGTESEVTVINSGKVSIKGLNVKNEIAPTLTSLKLQHLLFPKLESVTATAHHVSSLSALEFMQCYGAENINPMVKNFASIVSDGNYGIVITNSTNVTTTGGMAHGLTPGFATGGSDDAGAVPSRNIVTRGTKISNTNLTRHAADFHGNVRDSVYIDCEILGTVTVGGLNNGYVNCRIKSAAALVPIDLGELVGGTVDLSGTTVEILSTGGVNRFIAYSSGAMAKGLKYDALLKVHNCTFIWGRGSTQLYSLILPTCSNAGTTINLELVSPKLVGFESMTVERFVMYNISSGAKRASRFIMRGAINVKYNTLVYDALGAGAVVEYPELWGNDAAKGRWIKRKDGSAEVYLTLTVNTAIDQANSIQGFLSTSQLWNFPFAFIAPPTIEVTTGATAAGAVTGTVTNALANYQLRSGSTQTAASHVVHLVARGQWATTP